MDSEQNNLPHSRGRQQPRAASAGHKVPGTTSAVDTASEGTALKAPTSPTVGLAFHVQRMKVPL